MEAIFMTPEQYQKLLDKIEELSDCLNFIF